MEERGFSLIELMVVVTIIGILATIAIPAYQAYTARAQLAEAMTLSDGYKSKMWDVWTQAGTCATNGAFGVPPASDISGKYVAQVVLGQSGSTCSVTATMRNNGVASGLQGQTLTLTMVVGGGALSWRCASSASPRYLPTACRS